ncbi:hypothetical protein DPEC_G00232200 [Dallia pectoralis]|uniref:Uncharacterized protein n=1 Tax=Dallia pectoralis TaxID=75939 RepID=A0ACC2FX92_DALPE|nr:hypothetical protein DPEC_G00232200 [Dallia pectoralis]
MVTRCYRVTAYVSEVTLSLPTIHCFLTALLFQSFIFNMVKSTVTGARGASRQTESLTTWLPGTLLTTALTGAKSIHPVATVIKEQQMHGKPLW